MLEEIKKRVCQANLELKENGVVIYTWGNVSEISSDRKYMIIKPSGIDYSKMSPEDMVIVDVESGKKIEGKWKPSSDTDTHLEIYRSFLNVGGIAHTHSTNAVAFAQAGVDIRAIGTTHADYFYGDIPCTRELMENEVNHRYELNTGKVIVEHIKNANYDPMTIPGILVKNHGPFSWGKDSLNAVHNAVVLEKIAEMNLKAFILNRNPSMKTFILDKHYKRKNGPNSYYGQKNTPH